MDDNVKDRAFTLYLIRHGESTSNINGYETGGNPFLSERGLLQARLLGERFSHIPLDAVYSSGFYRAVATADEIRKQQAINKKIQLFPLLTECGYAKNDVDLRELQEKYNGELARDCSLPLLIQTDSDDKEQQSARAKAVLEYFCSHYSNGEYVAAVTHAVFLTYIFLACLDMKPEDKHFRINFYNTGVTKIIFYKGGKSHRGEICKIDYVNDAYHLKAAECGYLRGK